MMRKWLMVYMALMFCISVKADAQEESAYDQKVKEYVSRYKELAMMEQMYSGIPACVILAQAIIETEGGSSELVTGANNHFGIKCKSGWTGATFTHTDDQPDECFRKYRNVAESYKDHSDYLKNTPRYAPLFKLSATDYAGWAFGLKQCGYATNPAYAQKLINVIENYKLQEYTYEVLNGNNDYYAAKNTAKPLPVKKDTIKTIAPPPAPKIDTFAFGKAKRNADSVKKAVLARVVDSTPKKDTSLLASLAKPTPQKDTPVKAVVIPARAQDTTFTRAIENIPSAKPVQKLADTVITKKDTPVKTTTAIDTNTNKAIHINSTAIANPIAATEAARQNDEPKAVTIHGLKAIYAHKGDMLLEYASKHNIRYAKLLEMNDMQDAPLEADMYIYLEKKGSVGVHAVHIVQTGETLHEISQAEAIQLKRLLAFNNLQAGEEPVTGTKLYMKQDAPSKPLHKNISAVQKAPATDSTSAVAKKSVPASNYISTNPIPVSVAATAQTVAGGTAAGNVANSPSTPSLSPANTETSSPAAAVITEVPDNANINTASPKDVPQEKLAHLKSQLDKVVYSNDTYNNEPAAQVPSAEENKEVLKALVPKAGVNKVDSSKYYTVKNGDTAFRITHQFNITMKQLNYWNNLDNTEIKSGMKLKVRE